MMKVEETGKTHLGSPIYRFGALRFEFAVMQYGERWQADLFAGSFPSGRSTARFDSRDDVLRFVEAEGIRAFEGRESGNESA